MTQQNFNSLAGKTLSQVAAEAHTHGLTYGQYSAMMQAEQVIKRPGFHVLLPKNSKVTRAVNGNADSMTDTQVEYMALYRNGMSTLAIASLCGVNKSTVSRGLERARSVPCCHSSDCSKCKREVCAIDEKYENLCKKIF